MNGEQALEQLYTEMYRAMITKDIDVLDALLDQSFVLVHMTGMRQSKPAFLQAIFDGTLNYYSCNDTHLDISFDGCKARVIGRSRVEASVFGGSRHTWSLKLEMDVVLQNKRWMITGIQAGTY